MNIRRTGILVEDRDVAGLDRRGSAARRERRVFALLAARYFLNERTDDDAEKDKHRTPIYLQ